MVDQTRSSALWQSMSDLHAWQIRSLLCTSFQCSYSYIWFLYRIWNSILPSPFENSCSILRYSVVSRGILKYVCVIILGITRFLDFVHRQNHFECTCGIMFVSNWGLHLIFTLFYVPMQITNRNFEQQSFKINNRQEYLTSVTWNNMKRQLHLW
jgi:hypothetical protein